MRKALWTFLSLAFLFFAADRSYADGVATTYVHPPVGLNALQFLPAHTVLCNPTGASAEPQPCAISGVQGAVFLAPSGGGANSDYAAIQAALDNSATRPVFLAGGTFDVCRELLIPTSGSLQGVVGGPIEDWGFGGRPAPAVVLKCSSGALTNGATAHLAFNGHYGAVANIGINGSQNDGSGVACFEYLNNASFTLVQNAWFNGCQGGGVRIAADGSKPGAQNQTGFLIRPHFINLVSENNSVAGIDCRPINGGQVTDVVLEFGDIGGNSGNGIYLGLGCGGQAVITNTKIDYNGGDCFTVYGSYTQMTNIWCDHDGGPLRYYGTNGAWGDFLHITDIAFAAGGDYVWMSGDPSFNITGIRRSSAAPIQLDGATVPHAGSRFQGGDIIYANADQAALLEPLLITPGASGVSVISPSGDTYTPDPTNGVRDFEVDLGTNCPCTLAAPTVAPVGIQGTFKIVQDATGSRALTLNAFLNGAAVTIGTNPGDATYVNYYVSTAGRMVVRSSNVVAAQSPIFVQQSSEQYLGDGPAASFSPATITALESGNMLLVRATYCNDSFCGGSPIAATTISGATCSLVSGTNNGGFYNAALWACADITAGAKSLTLNFAGSVYYVSVFITEWKGANTSTPVDDSVANSAYVNNAFPGSTAISSANPLANNDLIYISSRADNFTAVYTPPGYVALRGCDGNRYCDAYRLEAPAGAYTTSFQTGSAPSYWGSLIAGFTK